MKLVNLIGFDLSVAGVTIPAGEYRAIAPQIQAAQSLPPVVFDGVGDLPVIRAVVVSLDQCVLQPGALPFPAAEEGTVYLATLPVREAAMRAGRTDVWGMGDRIDPKDLAAGVRNLVAP